MIGERYGRLVITAALPAVKGHRMAMCRCDCGTEKVIAYTSLTRPNNTRSCGCLARETAANNARTSLTKHGHAGENKRSRTYRAWLGMSYQQTIDHARKPLPTPFLTAWLQQQRKEPTK